MADGHGLGMHAAAFDDHVEIELVRLRDRLERSEDRILQIERWKVILEVAAVDGDLAGAFGHPDAGNCGLTATCRAFSSGGCHGKRE